MKTLRISGKMSTFGGPRDMGVTPSEGLALFEKQDLCAPITCGLFLDHQPSGTSGLARRLDPDAFYLAMRWDYAKTPRQYLRKISVKVSANGRTLEARPVDWGPNIRTNRIADLSPGLARALGLNTDDTVTVEIPPTVSEVGCE